MLDYVIIADCVVTLGSGWTDSLFPRYICYICIIVALFNLSLNSDKWVKVILI